MVPNSPLLCLKDIAVRYGSGERALEGLSLEMARGEIVAVLGPNGAGKTTVLRAVSGLLQFHGGVVDRGSVEMDGRPITLLEAPSRVRLGIAQVMEGRRVFGGLTVAENLWSGAHTRPPGREGRERANAIFERVLGYFPILGERLRGTAGYLSGGEQQMLAIGRALMAQPRLLLLDEPSLGVAPKIVAQIGEILQRINADGVSMLLVEQNANVALALCHRAVVLERGRVAMQGAAQALKSDPRVREVYLGLAGDGRRSFRQTVGAHA